MSNSLAAVKGIVLDSSHNFLILKQEIKDGRFFWDIPGGKVDTGEDPYETLPREIKEELNMDVQLAQPVGMWYFQNEKLKVQVTCTTFYCFAKSKPEITDQKHGIKEFKWVSRKEYLNNYAKDSVPSLVKLIKSISF